MYFLNELSLTSGGSECEGCTPPTSLQGIDIDLVIGSWLQSCSDEQHSEKLYLKATPSSFPNRTLISAHL